MPSTQPFSASRFPWAVQRARCAFALAQTSAVDCEAFTRSRSTPDNWLSTSLTFMLMPTAPPCNTSTMKRSKCSPASSEANRPVRSSRCRRNGCSDGRWSIQSTPHPTSLPPGWSRSVEQCQIFRGWVSWSTSLYDPFEWTDAPMPPPDWVVKNRCTRTPSCSFLPFDAQGWRWRA